MGLMLILKLRKYKGTINYNSTVSVKYKLTSGFGANLISTGTLLPNRPRVKRAFRKDRDCSNRPDGYKTMGGATIIVPIWQRFR